MSVCVSAGPVSGSVAVITNIAVDGGWGGECCYEDAWWGRASPGVRR